MALNIERLINRQQYDTQLPINVENSDYGNEVSKLVEIAASFSDEYVTALDHEPCPLMIKEGKLEFAVDPIAWGFTMQNIALHMRTHPQKYEDKKCVQVFYGEDSLKFSTRDAGLKGNSASINISNGISHIYNTQNRMIDEARKHLMAMDEAIFEEIRLDEAMVVSEVMDQVDDLKTSQPDMVIRHGINLSIRQAIKEAVILKFQQQHH